MFVLTVLAAMAEEPSGCAPVNLWKKVPELSVLTDPAAVNAGIEDAERRLECSAYVDPTRLVRLHLVGAMGGGESAEAHLVRIYTLFPDEALGKEERERLDAGLVASAREEAARSGRVELRARDAVRVDGIPLAAGERRTFAAGAHLVQWGTEEGVAGKWATFGPSTRWDLAPGSTVQRPGRPGAERRLGIALGVTGASLALAGVASLVVGTHLLHDEAVGVSVDAGTNATLDVLQGAGVAGAVAGTALMLTPILSGSFQ